MNCKKCGNLIDKEANFCPYCGESIQKEIKKEGYEDPFKNLRINTHDSQYQYQQNYSNQNQEKVQNNLESKKPTKSSRSLIGLLLGIVSIFVCFISHLSVVGIGLSIIAFILAVTGMRQTSRGLGIASLIVTIFTFIITVIINIIIAVFSLELTFANGYTTTIKDYFIDAFFCGYNEHHLEGYWLSDYNELLYLDDEGNYYIYSDANELTDNYYYGTYELEEGWSINNDEIIYANSNYYFYEMKTILNKTKVDGTIYYETIDLIENGFTIKLDKETKNSLILVGNDGETEIEFQKK